MSEQRNCTSCLDSSGAPGTDAPEQPCTPYYVGGPTPSEDTQPSRFDLARKLTRKGMLGLAAGTMLGVVALPKAAEAVTCSCGTIYATGFVECEYAWYAAVGDYRRTGRKRTKYQRRYDNGTASGCGAVCEYWGPWACSIYACPPNMPGYC